MKIYDYNEGTSSSSSRIDKNILEATGTLSKRRKHIKMKMSSATGFEARAPGWQLDTIGSELPGGFLFVYLKSRNTIKDIPQCGRLNAPKQWAASTRAPSWTQGHTCTYSHAQKKWEYISMTPVNTTSFHAGVLGHAEKMRNLASLLETEEQSEHNWLMILICMQGCMHASESRGTSHSVNMTPLWVDCVMAWRQSCVYLYILYIYCIVSIVHRWDVSFAVCTQLISCNIYRYIFRFIYIYC